MPVRALLFDINGTLIDIKTDEAKEEIYRAIGHFLTYQGIDLRRWEVRDLYFRLLEEQRATSGERYAEFDAERIWAELINRCGTAYTRTLDDCTQACLPRLLAQLFRGISRKRLQLYPGVRETLNRLRPLRFGAVSDAQTAYAHAELNAVGLIDYFDTIVISGRYGYRKPDARLFEQALLAMHIPAHEVLYIGNDMYRDIYGAQQAGLKAIFFASHQGEQTYKDVRPNYIIHSFEDLPKAVEHIERH